jgi:biotin carboxyl carrier protein
MTFEVETRGRRRTVDARRSGKDWDVLLDGLAVVANVTVIGDRWSLLIGTRSYEVSVDRRTHGERTVHINGVAVPVSIRDPRSRLARRVGADAAGAASRSIVAPMPGRIVKVLVKPGDEVAQHQGLVVIEAMKMENELRALRAGRVRDVHVTAGMSVEGKTVLIEME